MATLNKKTAPLVTIIMPVFNTVEYIKQAIKSIQNQSLKDWELILIDDYSTDGSFELMQKIAKKDCRITVYRNGRHRGAAGAVSYGL